MTKIFGFTKSHMCGHIIGFGKKCICWNVYWGKVTKKLHGWFYMLDSDDVLFNLHVNNAGKPFWILGIFITDLKPIIDNID